MELKPCPFCHKKPKVTTVKKIGVPSGDNGYETTIECHKYRQVIWALRKSWCLETSKKEWNRRVDDDK